MYEKRRESCGCSHSCATVGVANEKVTSRLFVGSASHFPYRSNQPCTGLPLCPLAGYRYSLSVQQTVEAWAIQPGFCGRCLNATLKNATFGCWSSNCFSRTGNDRSPMASNCSLLRCSCRLSYTDHSNSRVMPRASTGQASTQSPQNRQRVMSM